MAGAAPNRRRPETMGEFVTRRTREQLDRLGGAASAAAHDAFGKVIRVGGDIHLPRTDDVLAFGADIVSGMSNKPKPQAAPAAAANTVNRPAQRSTPPARSASSPVRTSEPHWLDELNRNPYAKTAAGYAGMVSGWIPGVKRGAEHMVEGGLDAALFASRAVNPGMDHMIQPPGERVGDQVLNTGIAVADYANSVRKDPSKLSRDLRQFGHQLNVDLNPLASPSADTAAGEFNRQHEIGKNQGELGLNIVTLPVGAELAAVSGVGRAARLAKSTRYLREAGRNKAADYLALPYEGMGHHSVFKRKGIPKRLGGGPWPEWLQESPFSVLGFRHLTKGEAYAKHAMADPSFTGANLGPGRGGWSSRQAGIEPLDGLARVWVGTPEATKALGGAMIGGGAGLLHEPFDGER